MNVSLLHISMSVSVVSSLFRQHLSSLQQTYQTAEFLSSITADVTIALVLGLRLRNYEGQMDEKIQRKKQFAVQLRLLEMSCI